MSTIDHGLLPDMALIDTGIIIRAFGEKNDGRTSVCREFTMAMLESDKKMLVAAPSISEAVRWNRDFELPVTPRIQVVAFDGGVARLLGKTLPEQILYQIKNESDVTHGYVKYDAMIVACAAYYSAGCVVHLDRRHFPKLAAAVGVTPRMPHDFQLSLFRTSARDVVEPAASIQGK